MSILVHPPQILLAVMLILGEVNIDNQYWSFRYILPERLVHGE